MRGSIHSPARMTFAAIFARTNCPECGGAIIVDGVTSTLACAACKQLSTVPPSFWAGLFFRLFAAFPGERQYQLDLSDSLALDLPIYARFREEPPSCANCHAMLNVSGYPVGSEARISCSNCHSQTATFPPPAFLQTAYPVLFQLYCAGNPDAPHAGREAPTDMRPVAFACTECGGKLHITADAPRVMDCNYCRVTLYLPDALWHALHPVQKRRPWWALFAR